MSAEGPRVAVVGLGAIGRPIAERLAGAGLRPLVWNRSPGPAQGLTERGAVAVARPEDAAADVVITVLPDLPQVEEVLDRADGLLAGWSRREQSAVPPLLVVMGTVSPTGVRVLAARLRDRDVHVVDAPVSGGVDGAQRGALSIMVGGDADDFGRLQPLLAVLGSTVRHLGPTGSGQLAKACNQIVVAATVAAVSEALALARASGLNAATIVELMSGGLAGSEVLRQKRDKWLNEDFSPGGSAINQLKDLRIAVAAAAAVDVDVPITRRTEELFARMVDEGLGDRDHAGLYLLLADRSRSRRQDSGGDAAERARSTLALRFIRHGLSGTAPIPQGRLDRLRSPKGEEARPTAARTAVNDDPADWRTAVSSRFAQADPNSH